MYSHIGGLELQHFGEDLIPSTAKSIKDLYLQWVALQKEYGGSSPFLINGRKVALCLEIDLIPSQKIAHYKLSPEKSRKRA